MAIKDSILSEFSRYPANLVGKLESVSVSPEEAWMNLVATRSAHDYDHFVQHATITRPS